jgi:phenylpropionate dioxygenase-like ring-hydroxylating dioxygenase large terminal subunit
MIPNMWYAVLDANEVKAGKPYAFKRLGEEMVFWRDKHDKVVAMRDRCAHRSAKLSPGKIVDGNIQCHFHGFQYNSEGQCQLIPANGRMGPRPKIFQCQSYPTREAHGLIWVWYGEPRDEYPPLPFFEELSDFAYSTISTEWNVDYTRAIEGALDVSHLPFVHANTIGRGSGTLVNGPYTTLENDQLQVWISNQPDAGLPALKPSQVPPPDREPDLWFMFPNVWRLYLGANFRNVLIFAPIDDEHVRIYVRTYIRGKSAISRAISAIGNRFNLKVLSEDYYITKTQSPKKSDINIGERFIPADRPIALYLQHRRQLMLGTTETIELHDTPELEIVR